MLENVKKFVELHEEAISELSKGDESSFAQLLAVAEIIQAHAQKYHEVREVFTKHGGDIHLPCPSCASPILLEYGDCPFCGEHLMSTSSSEKKESKPTKVADKPKETKKADLKLVEEPKKKKTVKESPVDVEAAVTPKKNKVAEKLESFQGTEEEIDDAFEETEETLLPSADEVNAMSETEIYELADEHSLSMPKGYKKLKLKDLRVACNKALDDLAEAEGEEEETEEVEEVKTPPKKSVKEEPKKVLVKETAKKKAPVKEEIEDEDDFEIEEEEEINPPKKNKAPVKEAPKKAVKEEPKKKKAPVVEPDEDDFEIEEEEEVEVVKTPSKKKAPVKEEPKAKKKAPVKEEEEEEFDLSDVDLEDLEDDADDLLDDDDDFEIDDN